MTPHYTDPLVTLYLGDCLDVMRELPDASVDSVVTDPPYGLGFMGKHWDHGVPGVDFWREMYRVLKPGGYLLSFAGTRTVHRFGVAIEDAGFEIRDTLMWIYASGFPKSLDVSKALDKAAGAEREPGPISPTWRDTKLDNGQSMNAMRNPSTITAPATDLARKWEGWGTALKPAHEPIVMARKPLVGTVAQNVTRYGTGAINVDACRIPGGSDEKVIVRATEQPEEVGIYSPGARPVGEIASANANGRWPSNVLLSDPELFDEPNPGVVGSGATASTGGQPTDVRGTGGIWQDGNGIPAGPQYGDSGGYSRFYLIPKADRAERERGLDTFSAVYRVNGNKWTDQDYRVARGERPPSAESGPRRNVHPTVKPIDLMRHLVRLVTPPGGVTLDPFLGSGTTALAASEEGFRCIGIEREVEYLEIAKGRLMATAVGMGL